MPSYPRRDMRDVTILAKYRYSRSTSPFEDAKKIYIIIGVCALVVIAGMVLSITMQNGSDPQDIPVVEQGDGSDGFSGFTSGGDVTSMGDIIIDDSGAPITEFEVTVTGADGLYRRDGEEASLVISGQNSESFGFELTVGETKTSGTAYFSGPTSAICEKADGALRFGFEAEGVVVTRDGTVSELGDTAIDGIYLLAETAPTEPTSSTETTSTTAAPAGGSYDLDIIKADSTRSALSGMMTGEDYSLATSLLDAQGGYGIIYGTGDKSKEKQGRGFNIDTQTDGVLFHAFEQGTGRETVIICAPGGKVYAGVCDGSEYHYYSNDPARSSPADAPNSIVQYAKIKKLTLS